MCRFALLVRVCARVFVCACVQVAERAGTWKSMISRELLTGCIVSPRLKGPSTISCRMVLCSCLQKTIHSLLGSLGFFLLMDGTCQASPRDSAAFTAGSQAGRCCRCAAYIAPPARAKQRISVKITTNRCGSNYGTKMEPWQVETWTKTCVTPPV